MNNKTEIWKQASEVYADIFELSPKDALAKLYGIENITSDVRKAVITLINAGSQASQYFSEEISDHYNIGIKNAQTFQVGQKLDEYELLEELGHGGMSQVFKAKRIDTDQQTMVAIKIFAPRGNSSELLKHFINEQKILSGLSHPHIVKMLHGGMTDDQTAYLVMELIEKAQPLDQYCKNNKFNNHKKIRLIAQCADALAYSHANLIIHRDLKPDNILINQNKELKIVDFGIAKLINNDISGNKTTIMALTPSYAAPEQINSQPISVKTDIFSLAVVALELASSNRPLPKDRLIKSCATDEQCLDAVLKKTACEKDLKNILRKALEQEPNKRYSSMQSFADDLNNYLLNKPVNATSQSLIYRIQKFAKRRAALFATLMSFLIFLIVGSFLGYQQYQQIKIEAGKAEIVKKFMLDSFEITNPDNTKGLKISADNLLKSATIKLHKNDEIDQVIKFELLQTLAIAYGNLGYYTQAIENLELSLKIIPSDTKSQSYLAQYLLKVSDTEKLSKLFDGISIDSVNNIIDKARFYRVNAELLNKETKFKESKTYLQKALKLEHKSKNAIGVIITKKQIAQLLYAQSKTNEAITLAKNLLEEPSLEKSSTLTLSIRGNLVTFYKNTGAYDLALNEIKTIIDRQKIILGEQHPDLGSSLILQSQLYYDKGDLMNSFKSAQEGYRIFTNLYGENNPTTATALSQLGVLSYMKQDTKKAQEQLEKVVEIYVSHFPPEHRDLLNAKTNLAGLLTALNQPLKSEVLLTEVYQIQMKQLGPNHLETLFTQQHLINALSYSGKFKEAVEMSENNVQASLQHNGLKDPIAIDAYAVLVRTYQKAKMHEKSLETGLFMEENKLFDATSPKYPVLLLTIAENHFKLQQPDQASTYYKLAIKTNKGMLGNANLLTIKAQLKYADFLKQNKRTPELALLIQEITTVVNHENIQNKALLKQLAFYSRE